ncbi:MAG: DUF4982 domain-containing protein [Draconibacterium sp.]|nr:DUF4982 domain-containing protein [Draconibacterium sp.]
MKNKSYLTILIIISLHFVCFTGCKDQSDTDSEKSKVNIDFNWKFALGDIHGAETVDFNDTEWRTLNVPHDWTIEGEYSPENTPQNAWLPVGVGWYRKILKVPEAWLNNKVIIHFDGVYMNSNVYVNGKLAGNRPYGFISFQYDITDMLKPGKNIIAVRVDNTPAPTSRFYHGSGIYGHVNLLLLPKVHITPMGGVFVRTAAADEKEAEIKVDTEIDNEGQHQKEVTVQHVLFDEKGDVVATSAKEKLNIGTGKKETFKTKFTVPRPQLWSPDTPYLYQLETTVKLNDKIIEVKRTPVGIRTIRFDSQTGFWINDKNIKLKGICEHQELSPVGLALPDALLKRRLQVLKNMGVNAIRTAHNPFTPKFYELCDEMGIMVMDEVFDGWHRKGANDYGGRFFMEWWKKDVASWVKRDRNHPSVILWSIGNETGKNDEHNITGEIHKYDDNTRPVTGGTVFTGVDVSGFNGPAGMPGVLEKFHKENPNQPLVLTEVPHTIQTRGFYRVPTWWRDKGNKKIHTFEPYGTKQIFFDGLPRYRSSYDNCGVRINARTSWKRTKNTPWISGEFRWTGHDCLGEAHFMGVEFPKRSYNSGVLDFAGFPKDLYYFYQSQWTKKPMVHILPHWTHPGLAIGTEIPVVAYSNCEVVELFLNGKSFGKKNPGELLDFVWNIPYASGELKAVGYIKGEVAAEKVFMTAKRPVKLELTTDNPNLKSDRRDVAVVSVSAHDESGEFVPWVQNRVWFEIEGPIKLLGYENGNPIDGTPHKVNYRNLFYGMARGFFQATDEDGPVVITAAAILGDTLFQEKSSIAIGLQRIAIRSKVKKADFKIYYTTDGTTPTTNSKLYKTQFEIDAETVVKAIIMKNGKQFMELKERFRKGKEPRFTDDRLLISDDVTGTIFNGPFDSEVAGRWKHNDTVYYFDKKGNTFHLDGDKRTKVGRWWYDFPDDPFENPNYKGAGEIFWNNSNLKERLSLTPDGNMKVEKDIFYKK